AHGVSLAEAHMGRREPVRLLHLHNVCFWHKADIAIVLNNVRFRVAIGSGAKIGGQLCPTSTRLSLAPDSPGRPWRGEWGQQASRSRSSNASCSAVHASTPAASLQRL